MKSQRHEKWSTITPESTIPKPPPMPKTAESRPIAIFIFSGGNSSRMIAKLSGKSAPPAPETTRNAISDQMFHANAAPTQPARKSPRLTSSIRSLPNWSPSRPSRGVATAAETRKPVSTQVVQAVRGVELLHEGRERREHHRLLQRERAPGQREDAQRDVVVLARWLYARTRGLYLIRCGSSASAPRVSLTQAAYSS